MNYLSGAAEWLQGFAVTCVIIGFLCAMGGLLLYGVADIVIALIAKHS
jgi:hypothetical protein